MNAVAGGAAGSRVALVTGGASGIGLAVVRRLAVEGYRVVVADLDETAGEAAAAEVDGRFQRTDVRDPEASLAAVSLAEKAYGGLDLVFLNAGVTTGTAHVETMDIAAYRTAMGVNLDGVIFGARAAIPALRRRGGGTILATASLAGLTPMPHDSVYTANKHAVVGFTRALAQQLEPEGITVSCICPGFAETPLIGAEVARFRTAEFPLLTANEVADAVLVAAHSEGTGEAWVVQPGRQPQPYRFRGVPGVAGGQAPPEEIFTG